MNRTTHETGKQGDGRSGAATGAAMSPQTGQSTSTGSQGSSTGFQGGRSESQGSSSTFTGQPGTSPSRTDSTATRIDEHSGQSQMHQGSRSEAEAHREGPVARSIEKQTAKLPSDLFLWAAAASIGVSAAFEFTGHKDKSRFVGQWVAPFLLLGVYNKLVKTQGSDRSRENFSGTTNDPYRYSGQRSY